MVSQRIESAKPFKIKPKVLWGFSLLLVLVLATTMVTYWGVMELAQARKTLTGPSQKLMLLNSTLTLIYQSESSIRAYTLNQEEKLLKQYIKSLAIVNSNVDSLSQLVANDSTQSKRVQQVKQLLARKKLVLGELITLKQTDWSSEFYAMAMREIERLEKDSVLRDAVIIKTTTTKTSKRDTIVKRTPREAPGFFSRLKGWFTGGVSGDTTITLLQVEERIKIDTLRHSWVPTDSLLRDVLGILNQIRIRQDETLIKLSAKELELLRTDLRLIDQIRAIVSLLEAEELNDNFVRAQNAQRVVGQSTILIISLGALALLISVLFVILILRAVKRSDFYRKQLVEANQYADKLLHAKEEFLANMSHEIRNPLTSVIGFAQLLAKTSLDENQKNHVQSIALSSEHLLDIVNDLLDLSKIDGGFLKLDQTPFYPFKVAQETITLFAARANEKGLKLNIIETSSSSILVVLGDAYRLKQMLINLIGNAIKFTEKGGVTITIGSTQSDSNNLLLTFEIADTGIGIDNDKINELFERFVQADRGITRKYGGTGLGLAIVKKLATLHGGSISATSTPSQGSNFTLTLPYTISQAEPEVSLQRIGITPSLPQTIEILVIDDDPLIRQLLVQLINYLGASAHAVESPTEALTLIKEGNFRVILSDIHMPIMSGFDFINEVKKLNLPNQPLSIAITADNVGEDTSPYTNAGFEGVVTKPFNEFSLYSAIAKVLNLEQPINFGETTMGPNHSQHFSLTDIERFCENDPIALAKVIESIIIGTEKGLDQLESLARNEDWDGFLAVTHRLKSTFGQIKATELLNIVTQAEGAATMHEIALVEELIGKLKSQFIPISAALSGYIKKE